MRFVKSYRPAVAAITSILALAGAGAASAQDYCVAPNTTCGGINVATLQDALDQAAVWNTNDRIFLGAATYVAPAGGFKYTPAVSPMELIGAGIGKTILTAPSFSSGAILTVTGGGAGVHDLTITLPSYVQSGYVGLDTDAWVEDIQVNETDKQGSARTGVQLHKWGALRDSTVKLAEDLHNNYGVVMLPGGTSLWNTSVDGETAVDANDGADIERSRLIGTSGAFVRSGSVSIKHSVVEFGYWGVGIDVGAQPKADTTLTVDGVVISSPKDGANPPLSVGNYLNPAQTALAKVRNSVLRGGSNSITVDGNGTGSAGVSIWYSDFDPSSVKKQGTRAHYGGAGNTNFGAWAGFVDAAGGDFHLTSGSPLIDAGDPASAPGSGDMDGNPLDTDGDGDGTARRDIGAYEAPAVPLKPKPDPQPAPEQPAGDPAPQPGAGDTTPPTADPGTVPRDTSAPLLSKLSERKLRLRYRLSEAATVAIKLQRSVVVRGHRRWRTTGTLKHASTSGANAVRVKHALPRGRYRVLVSATDAAGNRSALRRVGFRVAQAGSSKR